MFGCRLCHLGQGTRAPSEVISQIGAFVAKGLSKHFAKELRLRITWLDAQLDSWEVLQNVRIILQDCFFFSKTARRAWHRSNFNGMMDPKPNCNAKRKPCSHKSVISTWLVLKRTFLVVSSVEAELRNRYLMLGPPDQSCARKVV